MASISRSSSGARRASSQATVQTRTVRLPALSTNYPACTNLPSLTCLDDVKIATELQWQVAHGVLPPPDANTLYVVHLPATVRVDDARSGPVRLSPPRTRHPVSFCSR